MVSKRRSSKVSQIDFGDTETPSFSTTHNVDQARASRHRQRALSGSQPDSALSSAVEGSSAFLRTNADDITGASTDASADIVGNTSPATGSKDSPKKQQQTTTKTHKKHHKQIPPAKGVRRLWLQYRELSYHYTWVNPLIILLFFLSWFAYDGFSEDSWLYPFICLSHKVPGTSDPVLYGKGINDFKFVAFYMIFFTFFREFWMGAILRPLAKAAGLTKRGKIHRFMEQAYAMVYYGISGPFGLYVMYHSDIWYFNTTAFYENFPHREHEFAFKLFYLLQASFWAQQSMVMLLLLEKPRKDFRELVFHHIVTIALIWLSYRFHFMKMGVAVYVTMDVSDFFLSASKLSNYLDLAVTPFIYGFFACVWVYMRHWLNLKFMWSILTEFRTVGDFTLNWETQQYKCWISQYITFALLFALHLLNLYWLRFIIRIGYRFLVENVQKDERSDDSDDEEEEEEEESDRLEDTSSSDEEKRKAD